MKNEINNLKINMAQLANDISYLKKGQDKNDEQHREIINKINENSVKMDNFIESSQTKFADRKDHQESIKKVDEIVASLDSKYASKWIEKTIIWAAAIIGSTTLVGLLYLIAEGYLKLHK
jgi:predicted  nucleic acid-binding Zn-ribbon protein